MAHGGEKANTVIVTVGSYDTLCVVARYADFRLSAMRHAIIIVAAYADATTCYYTLI